MFCHKKRAWLERRSCSSSRTPFMLQQTRRAQHILPQEALGFGSPLLSLQCTVSVSQSQRRTRSECPPPPLQSPLFVQPWPQDKALGTSCQRAAPSCCRQLLAWIVPGPRLQLRRTQSRRAGNTLPALVAEKSVTSSSSPGMKELQHDDLEACNIMLDNAPSWLSCPSSLPSWLSSLSVCLNCHELSLRR